MADHLEARFQELQEELHAALFTHVAGFPPSIPLPSFTSEAETFEDADQSFDFSRTSIPKFRVLKYLNNWIAECAPHLDKFDDSRHFSLLVPSLAKRSPALFYAILTFSAKQSERKTDQEECYYDSLQFYQASIELLVLELERRDPTALVTCCVLASMEFMSASARNWKRHVKGCTALIDSFCVNGFSGGLLQAVFWCYARMDLGGAIMSDGTERTALHIDKWVPQSTLNPASRESQEKSIMEMFHRESYGNTDMHANWAVYLCAKACDLEDRRNKFLERNQSDAADPRSFEKQWLQLWDELQYWAEHRSAGMLPLRTSEAKESQDFPEIFFIQWPAISANQLYHAACIIMLEMRTSVKFHLSPAPQSSALWHARQTCGIALTNPHSGSLTNAIQPLFLAGKLLSHSSQHLIIARLFNLIDRTTGWSAMWRLRDLEQVWGYMPGEISSQVKADTGIFSPPMNSSLSAIETISSILHN